MRSWPNGRRLRSIAAVDPGRGEAAFEAYVAVGVDEVMPGRLAELDQVELLADVVASPPRTTIRMREAVTSGSHHA